MISTYYPPQSKYVAERKNGMPLKTIWVIVKKADMSCGFLIEALDRAATLYSRTTSNALENSIFH